MTMNAVTVPASGDITMNAKMLLNGPIAIDSKPDLTIAAPINPPIRVCEELIGRPKNHVISIHEIAPNNAANITIGVIIAGFTIPLPIVFATLGSKTKSAMKLNIAAIPTAFMGDNTLVETTVAIELAESCIPLKKSNANATSMISIIRGSKIN